MRALRVAPACQLMLDVPGAEGGAGRDPGRVWAQMPDTARARVLCLLAAIAGHSLNSRLCRVPGALCYRLALSMAFGVVLRLSWQFYFFLRTDLYYLATTVLGCNDLQATARQVLRARVRWLLGQRGPLAVDNLVPE